MESESLVGSVPLLITEILADMTEEEAKAKGFNTLEEFKETWRQINGPWNPDTIVTVYEFILHKVEKPKQPNTTTEKVL